MKSWCHTGIKLGLVLRISPLILPATTAPQFQTTGFEKKSNKGAKIFLISVIVVGLGLVAALAFVLFR